MRFCINCGAELSEGVKFCSKCGVSVDFIERTEHTVSDADGNAAVEMPVPAPEPEPKPEPKPEPVRAHEIVSAPTPKVVEVSKPVKNSISAITAFILGLFSLFNFCSIFSPITSVLAIIVSIIGICCTKRGKASGRCLAVIGLILAISALLLSAAVALGIAYFAANYETLMEGVIEPIEDILRAFDMSLRQYGMRISDSMKEALKGFGIYI